MAEGVVASADATMSPSTWTDSQFIPASPAQGPFLELLTHAPQHGLALIRQLVDHAIAFDSDGQPHGSNVFVVAYPNGPWTLSLGGSPTTGHAKAAAGHSRCSPP